MTDAYRMRLCIGSRHVEGCHHEPYLRHGVERLLSHPRTLEVVTLALCQERPIHPEVQAKRILLEMARVAERLDSLEPYATAPAP